MSRHGPDLAPDRAPRLAALVSAVLVLLSCAGGTGGRAVPVPAVDTARAAFDAAERDRQLAAFDQIWTTVHEQYWDPQMGGVDWDAARDELRPRVAAARSVAEAREAMRELIARLGQSHFALIGGDVYQDLSGIDRDTSARGSGVAGLTVRVHDGRALVVDVADDGAAAAHGVRPGWQVLEVDGAPVGPVIERVAAYYAGSPRSECMASLAVEAQLSGPHGGIRQVVFDDGTGRRVRQELPLGQAAGDAVRIGHMPTIRLEIDRRTLDGGVGYFGFSAFVDPMRLMGGFGEFVTEHLDAPGIVIDLRGNPGGLGAMAMGMGGWFVDRTGLELGTMTMRDTTLRFVLNPRGQTYTGRLAILVDGCSASTSEIFAGGLQDLGRARVFGTHTGGAALPSRFERLPNGDGLQYAFANYVSVGGETLEGRGVTPDVTIVPDPVALLAGGDPVFDAALAWILADAVPGRASGSP